MGKKKFIFIILAFVVIIILFLIFKLSQTNYSTDKKIKKEFDDNYDTILRITKTLEETSYSKINIQNVDYVYDDGNFGTWYVRNDENGSEGVQKIQDSNLVVMLNEIFKERKYQVVSKNGDTISFQLWSNLDVGKGIAYVTGGEKPSIDFLTKCEKLGVENWFYYEADFNEWKKNNEQ